ncbi:MAG: hypothetical protein ACRDHF_09890 [Tepidiformaceae bacterium]
MLVAALLIGSSGSACYSPDAASGDPEATSVPSLADDQPEGAPRPKPIPNSTLALVLPRASDYEKQLLADGELTLAEYEAAKLAQVQCLQEAGLRVINPHMNGVYLYTFMVAFESPSGDLPAAVSSCNKQHAGVIDQVWAEVSIPLAQATIDTSRRMMAECYEESGLKVQDHPESSADPFVVAKHERCTDEVQAALNIEGISYGVDGDARPR